MLLRPRTLPAAFIPPCLAYESGLWLHENKHDRFRVIARKDETRTGPPGRSDLQAAYVSHAPDGSDLWVLAL